MHTGQGDSSQRAAVMGGVSIEPPMRQKERGKETERGREKGACKTLVTST